jgi:hypothetical protein
VAVVGFGVFQAIEPGWPYSDGVESHEALLPGLADAARSCLLVPASTEFHVLLRARATEAPRLTACW